MIEQLAPVVAIPAVMAAAWTAVALRLARSPLWLTGSIVAAGLAGVLVVIAAFLPLIGVVGSLAVPVLCVGGGVLLMWLFARPQPVAGALAAPFAVFVMVQPQWFPLVLPLILVLPLWTVGWLGRERDAGRYVVMLLISLIAVPAVVFGVILALRGSG